MTNAPSLAGSRGSVVAVRPTLFAWRGRGQRGAVRTGRVRGPGVDGYGCGSGASARNRERRGHLRPDRAHGARAGRSGVRRRDRRDSPGLHARHHAVVLVRPAAGGGGPDGTVWAVHEDGSLWRLRPDNVRLAGVRTGHEWSDVAVVADGSLLLAPLSDGRAAWRRARDGRLSVVGGSTGRHLWVASDLARGAPGAARSLGMLRTGGTREAQADRLVARPRLRGAAAPGDEPPTLSRAGHDDYGAGARAS